MQLCGIENLLYLKHERPLGLMQHEYHEPKYQQKGNEVTIKEATDCCYDNKITYWQSKSSEHQPIYRLAVGIIFGCLVIFTLGLAAIDREVRYKLEEAFTGKEIVKLIILEKKP